jgi:diguanylate cyclase (GGDEF)-like protein
MSPTDTSLAVRDTIIRLGVSFAACVGAIVLIGSVGHFSTFQNLWPGWATMKPSTALGLIASGASLWLLHFRRRGSAQFRIGRILAGVIVAVGVVSCAERIDSLDFGLRLHIVEQASGALRAGLMAPSTALAFTLLGLSLLAFRSASRRVAAMAHWMALATLVIATLALAGYACGAQSLYAVAPFASMALHTAGCLAVLALAALTADSDHGVANLAMSASAGGVVTRRLLLTLPPALFLLGWVCLGGELAGWYDSRFSIAVMILVGMAVCMAAVWSTAGALRSVDLARRSALDELVALNLDLEKRVEDRTRRLATVSETLRTTNRTLEHLSFHDPLTGIANRRYFERYFAMQMAIARREARPLSLVMCDVDAFKAFNDRYGHPAGDECLRRIAEALQSCCRQSDDMAARYGGEEFALILPNTDAPAAAAIAEAARMAVAGLAMPHGCSPVAGYVTICCGVAGLRPQHLTVQHLIEAADENLFRAKEAGRDRVVAAVA